MVSTPIIDKTVDIFGELRSEQLATAYGSVLSNFERVMQEAIAISESTDLTSKVPKDTYIVI